MNKEFETIQDKVKDILANSETSRNSDASLVANYWYKWDNEYLVPINNPPEHPNPALCLHKYIFVTQPSVIERARRLIQFEIYKMPDATDAEREAKLELMKKYYPTDPKIIKRRRLSSRIWKDYINTRQINNLIEGENNEQDSKQ